MKLFLALLMLLVSGIAQAQPSGPTVIIDDATPTVGGTVGDCIKKGATGAVNFENCAGNLLNLKQFTETYSTATISTNVLAIDLSLGSVFNVTNNANITTVTITNAIPGKTNSFTMVLSANGTGYTQAGFSTFKFANNTPPTLTTTAGKYDILTFFTNDGGTTWFGFIAGQNFGP